MEFASHRTGSLAAIRLSVHGVKSVTDTVPLPGADVVIRLREKAGKIHDLYRGQTAKGGMAEVQFQLPNLPAGEETLASDDGLALEIGLASRWMLHGSSLDWGGPAGRQGPGCRIARTARRRSGMRSPCPSSTMTRSSSTIPVSRPGWEATPRARARKATRPGVAGPR